MSGIKEFFKTAAPMLGTVAGMVGGPYVGVAVNVIKAVTGKDVKPAALADHLTELASTPEGLAKLREIENQFQLQMKQLGIDEVEKLEQIAAADRDSARRREVDTHDTLTPRVLAFSMLGIAGLIVAALLFGWNREAMRDTTTSVLVGSVFGYVFRELGAVFTYYFGSSAGSDRKTELLADAEPVKRS